MNIHSLDTHILLLINRDTVNWLFDILMPALSKQGYLLIIPYLLAMLVWGGMRKNDWGKTYLTAALWTVVIGVFAVYLAEYVEDVLKVAVGRERPCRTIEGIRLLVACPKSFSLPSGHAITSFSAALPLFYLTKNYVPRIWRFFPLVLASLIAFSRTYLGVHYPTDVLAGAFLGSAIGLLLSFLYRLIAAEKRTGNKA